MFLQFTEDKERIKYGGSAFLELQYCKAKRGTEIKQLCAIHNIRQRNELKRRNRSNTTYF